MFVCCYHYVVNKDEYINRIYIASYGASETLKRRAIRRFSGYINRTRLYHVVTEERMCPRAERHFSGAQGQVWPDALPHANIRTQLMTELQILPRPLLQSVARWPSG